MLILGDVLANMDQYTGIPGLHEPKPALTSGSRSETGSRRASSRRWSRSCVCFGHGAPLRDPKKLTAFVEGLSD